MKITNTQTGTSFTINANALEGFTTKTLYVRTGFINGTKFISQKGNGAGGAGDVCRLDAEQVEVRDNLYNRLMILAEKANCIKID